MFGAKGAFGVPKKQNRKLAVSLIVVIIVASLSTALIGYWADPILFN